MLINVMYPDHRFDMIKADRLEGFIQRGEIIKFKRSSGWVTIGADPIRGQKNQGTTHTGPERRQISQTNYSQQPLSAPAP